MLIKGFISKTRVAGGIFLLFFLGYGLLSQEILLDFWATEEIFTARTFPEMIAVGGILCALLLIISPGPETAKVEMRDLNLLPVLLLLTLLVAFSLLIAFLGFLIAGFLMLTLAFTVLGERRPLLLLGVSLPVVLGLYLLLTALDIHLDPGLLRELL